MTDITEPTNEANKRLKESDWIVIVALWERGEVTLSELSDRFGISKAALSQGLKRRKAVRGSKAHIATKKIQEKIESEKEKIVEDIYNFKKRFVGYTDYLSDMAVETVRAAKAPGGSGLANCRAELASLAEAMKVIDKGRDNLFHLYGMYDKNNDNSENFDFNVGVYSEKDVEEMREAQKIIEALELEKNDDDDDDEDYLDPMEDDGDED